MWVFTLVEEHKSADDTHHYFASYVDRETGKQFALRTLSLVIYGIKAGAYAGADFCLQMAEQIEYDGDRLNQSDEGDWLGAAGECDGDHQRGRNLTYFLKYMGEDEAEEVRQQFIAAFGEPIQTQDTPTAPDLQPALA